MISGTGIDIVEVDRIRESIEKNERFKTLVFSTDEILYCEKQATAYQSYAARFAAKEALFKALGTGWRGKLAFNEVSVVNDQWGKPYIHLTGDTLKTVEALGSTNIHISISHAKAYATAVVIIEKLSLG
ncbi:holo-ACP synthase [Cesiribacter sp. SM1]|uniref:holo-ACP synthase n=1 Tax=Cesiribacter sp. SM1 TaxID=2861196 RepID=UPI001CD23427|nr:holo-ACP synthase [Cesiribacter sp. SM1]